MFRFMKHLIFGCRRNYTLFSLQGCFGTSTSLTHNLQSPLLSTFLSLVGKCSSMKQLKCLHSQIIIHGLAQHTLAISKLISFCALSRFGDIRYAKLLFDKIPKPNRHMYNSLIRGYSNVQDPDKAILLYKEMVFLVVYPNEFTFPFVLKACAVKEAGTDGILVHLMAIKLGYDSHVCVQNGLINLYIRCAKLVNARKVFDGIWEKTTVSWNSMIGGYLRLGSGQQAILLFKKMWESGVRLDNFTLLYLLPVSSQGCKSELGRFIHCYVLINGIGIDVRVQNALLSMYANCGKLHEAQTLFDSMIDRNVVSWTSLLSAYAKNGCFELAKDIFSQMPVKNVVSWNSMISGFVREGCWQEAVDLFFEMYNSKVEPDETTLVSVPSACCQLGDLDMGDKIYAYVRDKNMQHTVTLYNALIDMYSKCGSIGKAFDLFQEMPEKNIVSWNVMIGALAFHGVGYKAIELFEQMQTSGMLPDKITFTGLLSACCHSGLTDIGRYYFDKMSSVYGLPRETEHYSCMVDILGREGFLDEAVKLIGKMPMKPDTVIWGSLLGACRIHRNIMVAKQVLKHLLELEPYSSALYVLMSNIYSEAQRWEDMKKLRKLMNEHGVKKHDAISSIEICGCIHEFMVSDHRHEDLNAIHIALDRLMDHLRPEGLWWCLNIGGSDGVSLVWNDG